MKSFTPYFKYPNQKSYFEGSEFDGKIVHLVDGSFIDKTWWPSFFPVAAGLITSGGSAETNVMSCACISVVDRNPFMVAFPLFDDKEDQGVQKERPRHTLRLIQKYREFTLNIPHVDPNLVRSIVICGSYSGSDTDKFSLSGLSKGKSQKIQTPIIKECMLNFECVLHTSLKLGTHTLIIGTVAAVHLDKEVREGRRKFVWRSLPELEGSAASETPGSKKQ